MESTDRSPHPHPHVLHTLSCYREEKYPGSRVPICTMGEPLSQHVTDLGPVCGQEKTFPVLDGVAKSRINCCRVGGNKQILVISRERYWNPVCGNSRPDVIGVGNVTDWLRSPLLPRSRCLGIAELSKADVRVSTLLSTTDPNKRQRFCFPEVALLGVNGWRKDTDMLGPELLSSQSDNRRSQVDSPPACI
jgi:hypothetical protein